MSKCVSGPTPQCEIAIALKLTSTIHKNDSHRNTKASKRRKMQVCNSNRLSNNQLLPDPIFETPVGTDTNVILLYICARNHVCIVL